jgi:hypothetical protein
LTYLERLAAILSETPRGVTDKTDKRVEFRNAPALGTDETDKFVNSRTTTSACRSTLYLEKTAGNTPQGVTDKTDRSPFVHPCVGSVGDLPRQVSRESVPSEVNSDNHAVRPAEVSSVASPAPASFFDHRCTACGQPARFGYGVRLLHGEEGRWFCAAHRPEAMATGERQ